MSSSHSALFTRANLVLLRLPFSLFLLPIFLLPLVWAPQPLAWGHTLAWGLILHLLVYPASNAYNSYMDQDTGSIGGVKRPPPATRGLFHLSILLDAAAVLLAYLVVPWLAAAVVVYQLVSKAYSYSGIRLKKHPWLSWAVVSLFQGGYTCWVTWLVAADVPPWQLPSGAVLAIITTATCLLAGNYPLTQVFQHEEDAHRGDITLSLRLGIRGTFVFSAAMFAVGIGLLLYAFIRFAPPWHLYPVAVALAPMLGYFHVWAFQVFRNPARADFTRTMWMNAISSGGFIAAFGLILLLTSV